MLYYFCFPGFLIFFFFKDILLCTSAWPATCYLGQADLEPTEVLCPCLPSAGVSLCLVIGSPVTKDGLEIENDLELLLTLLPELLECWTYRCIPSCLAWFSFYIWIKFKLTIHLFSCNCHISYVQQSHVFGNFHIQMIMVVSNGVGNQELNQKLLQ